MFEGILEKLLQQKLGKYLEGIDKKNLSVGVWGGNILLENLLIKASIFESNGLPLRLKFGKIKKLSMKVPWSRLSSAPVEIILQTLYLVVEPKGPMEWETKDTWSYAYKKRIIEEFISMMAANLKMQLLEKQESKEDGYVDRLVTKIVDNLQLTIQNIHIRYEDSISMPNHFFSLGITLKELSINTTNSDWSNTYFDRLQSENKDKPLYKRLKIEGLAIYLQVDDPVKLSKVGQIESSENHQVQFVIQKSEIDRQIEQKLLEMFSREDHMIDGIQYLILPIELEIRLTQLTKLEFDKPMFNLEANLQELGLVLHKKQYEAIFKIMDFLQRYSKFSQENNSVKKYQFIRPVYPIGFKETEKMSLLERKIAKKFLKKQASSREVLATQIVAEPSLPTMEEDDEFFDALDDQDGSNNHQLDSMKSSEEVEEVFQSFIARQGSQIKAQDPEEIKINEVNMIEQFKNMNAVEWWRFAISGVLKDIRFKKGSWTEFKLTKYRKREYGRQLINLVRKCLTKDYTLKLESLTQAEQYLFSHILQANELQDLQNWIGMVVKRRIEKEVKEQKEKESKESSLISYFMSWGGKSKQKEESKEEKKLAQADDSDEEEFTLNDDEIEEIKASIKSSLTDLPSQSLSDLNLTEEEKAKLVKLQLFCNFQKGKISLMENNQIVEIFQQDLIVEFKTLRDESFDAIIKNKNAGLFVQPYDEKTKQFGIKKHLVRKLEKDDNFRAISQDGAQSQIFQEESYLWVLTVSKDNSAIDDLMNINFESSPIFITYDATGISSIGEFFKADYAEELKTQAYDKLSQIKDQTSVSVQDLLQKKQNNFTIKIASPMIEIPFLAHNSCFVGEPEELRPRTWIVNLGNIFFKNVNSSQEVDEYERFYLKIYDISLQYLKHEHLAQVLEEVTIELDVAVKNDLKAAILRKQSGQSLVLPANEKQDGSAKIGISKLLSSPEVLVNAKIPALQLNMSPDIFNGLVNITEVLKRHGPEEDMRRLKVQKDKIIQEASFKDQVQTRGVRGYNNYWTTYYTVTSGNYLYFYKSKRELMPYHYISLKEIQLETSISPSDQQGYEINPIELSKVIQIKSKGGEKIFLRFVEKDGREEFKNKVIERQKEILLSQENQSGISVAQDIVHKNPNEVGVKLDFQIQNIELRIYQQTDQVPTSRKDKQIQISDEKSSSQWLFARVQNLNLNVVQYTYEIKLLVNLSSLNLRETKILNKDLIRNEEGKNLLEIEIDVFDLYSPNIEDSEIIINANLGKLLMLFEPNTINEALKFFRNVKSSRKKDLESIQHQLMSEEAEGEVNQIQTCEQIKLLLIKANVKASGLSILCAHHQFYTPVFEMSLGQSLFNYDMHYDHDLIEGRFKDCLVFDYTDYPRTVKPWEGAKADLDTKLKFARREIIGTRILEDSQSNEIYFKTQIFNPECPKHPKDKLSILDLDVSQVKILYQLEQAFRIQDYFFDKFLWALTETDPYAIQSQNLTKDLEQIIKNGRIDSESLLNFDLQQKRNDMIMNIKIHRPYAILKDRPYSLEMLEIDLGEITISTVEFQESNRFKNTPQKALFFTTFVINGSDLGISYKDKESREFEVTDAFDLQLNFAKINWTPYIGLIDSTELDKSHKVEIEFQPDLQLKMTQEVYCYLLRCIDLNLAFTDGLENQFVFANMEEYFKTQDFIKKSQIKINTTMLQLSTFEDNKILTQLALQNPYIVIDQFLNKRYNYDIQIENICSFFKSDESKQLLFGKLTQIHKISHEDDPSTVLNSYENLDPLVQVLGQQARPKQIRVQIQMYPNGAKEFQVQVTKLKLFVYPYFYLMLFNFFSEGMPKYDEDSFDKPNEFNDNFEEMPELKMTLNFKETLLCFAPEQQQNDKTYKTIACQAFVEYEFKREKIRRIKNQLYQQLKGVNSLDQLGSKNIQLPISWMRLQGQELCPFICDLSDLEMFQFDEVNKRELVSPFNLSYFYARYLQFKPTEFKLSNFEKSEIKLDLIMLKISYYDVKLLVELFNEFNDSFDRFNQYFKLHSRQRERSGRHKQLEEQKDEFTKRRKSIQKVGDEEEKKSYELQEGDDADESTAYKTTQKALQMLTSIGRKQTIKQKKDDFRQKRLNMMESNKDIQTPQQPSDQSRDPDNFIEDLDIDYDCIEQKLHRIQSSGLQVVVINDHNNTFYPVLSLNLYSFLYKMQAELDKTVGDTQLKGMVSYYNSQVGEWEPLIEKVRIQYLSDSYKDQNFILLSFRNDLNINITSQLMQILIKTQMQLQDKNEAQPSMNQQSLIGSNRNTFNAAINNSFLSSSSSVLSRKKDEQKDPNSKQQNDYKVTPYTIVNHCAKPIRIQRVFQQDHSKRRRSKIPNYYDLQPGETIDYEVDYEEQAQQMMKISKDELVRKHDYINVIFNNGESMLKNINLRDLNHYHHEFNESNTQDHDYVGYGVNLDSSNMKKVFMLRSPYVINNVTDLDYQLKILKQIGTDPQNRPVFQEVRLITLKPQQCYPISFEEMKYRFSISSQSSPNMWSNPINFRTVAEKVAKNKTTYLFHGKQFSVITKIKSEFKKCYNINIKTPVIIKNALPCNMRIRSNLIVSQRQRLNKKTQKPEIYYEYETKEFYLPKGQSLQLYNYNLFDEIQFQFTLDNDHESSKDTLVKNNCFLWTDAKIENDEYLSEKQFVIRDFENKQSQLELQAKMSVTKMAGVQVTFYSKNIIINNTDQKLMIYYDKKIPAAGQLSALDNSVILVSNREKAIVSITQPDGTKQFSDPFFIDVAGVTNTLSVRKSKYSFFEFKVKTELSLACSNEEIYSKVTTISPCYVFFNKTKKTLLVRQDESSDDVQILLAGQRMPFYYYDARRPELISIKSVEREGAEFDDGSHDWTFKFSVKEIGRMTIFNRSTKDICMSKFILVEKDLQESNQITFVTFSEEDKKFPTYKIENKSRKVYLKYHQKELPHHEDLLQPGESRVFSWTNPLAEQMVTCSFYSSQASFAREFERRDLQLDDLNLRIQIPLPDSLKTLSQREFYVYTITNGHSRILTVSDISLTERLKQQKEEEKEQRDTVPKQTINIQLSAIGLSLIVQSYQLVRKEFAFVYLEGIKFIVVDTDDLRELQLKVNYLQIDNNVNQKQVFPVILYPKDLVKKRDQKKKDEKKGKDNSQEDLVKDFFNSVITIRKNVPNVVFFEQVNFLVQTMVIQMDDELIGYVFKFLQNISDSTNTNFTGVHEVFRVGQIGNGDDWLNYDQSIINKLGLNEDNQLFQILERRGEESEEEEEFSGKNRRVINTVGLQEDFQDQQFRFKSVATKMQNPQDRRAQSMMNSYQNLRATEGGEFSQTSQQSNKFSAQHSQSWMNYKLDDKGKQIYIKEYRSSPIDIELSFLSRGKMEVDSADKQFSLFDRIKTFGLTLANVDNAPVKINSFIAFNIFGTSADLKNKFTSHYSQSLKKNLFSLLGSSSILGNPTNFFSHISTGMTDFLHKPIEGMIQGPLEGGRGIIDGTGSLIKNTVQGTFGSASKMISSVSKGLLFITDDMDFIKKREEENMDKPKNVIEGLGYGLKSTFTGIASGITGVIENPIAGAKQGGVGGFFKGTYKGVAGLVVKPISGTLDFFSKTSEGIKNTASFDERKVNKIRIVRPFYGKIQLIKIYDVFHAVVVQHLQKMSRGAFSKDHFVEALHYASAKENLTLIMTEEHLLIVDTKSREVTKYWDSKELNNVKKLGANMIQLNVINKFELINQRRNEQANSYEAFKLQVDDAKQFEKFYKKLRYYIYKMQSES